MVQRRVRPAIVRYGYGVLVVVLAFGAAVALRSFDLEGFLFVIAVAVAVWIGGRGPGVLSIMLSVLVLHYVFIAPRNTGGMLPTYAYFVVFSVLVVLITAVSEARHRAETSLVEARDRLEAKVAERTGELERSNEELRKSERRYRSIFELAGVAIVEEDFSRVTAFLEDLKARGVTDVARHLADHPDVTRQSLALVKVTDVNQAAARLFGAASKEEFLANVGRLTTREVEDAWLVQLPAIAEGRTTVQSELTLTTLQNEKVSALVTIVAPAESSEFDRVLVTVVDLTERQRAQEALDQAQAALAHMTRVTTLGELTASIAHEVNQPLAAIVNNANAIQGFLSDARPDLDEIRAASADITRDADHASVVIERVRGLAKRSPSEKAPVQLAEVVQEVMALAASELAARRVAIRRDVPGDLPLVLGDRVQLQQVLLNLVVNGMEAMSGVEDAQGRLLEIRGRRDVCDGRVAATISVTDHGVGLNGTDMRRLFDAFYTTKTHGMGMGLAISRSIIEAHGGRLWADTNRESGATMSFTLPAAAADVA
jgi:C4-dicarboxylate-specific signal transduction histidine kinase